MSTDTIEPQYSLGTQRVVVVVGSQLGSVSHFTIGDPDYKVTPTDIRSDALPFALSQGWRVKSVTGAGSGQGNGGNWLVLLEKP
jgi:hypothetical protein